MALILCLRNKTIGMRMITLICIGIFMILSCDAKKQPVSSSDVNKATVSVDTIKIENKELEYEITIIEMGFESWLATQRSSSYFTQPTLESKNLFYVTEWNRRVMLPNGYNGMIYERQINYDPKLDYGMEVNYLLYMYFQFFQEKYKQKL